MFPAFLGFVEEFLNCFQISRIVAGFRISWLVSRISFFVARVSRNYPGFLGFVSFGCRSVVVRCRSLSFGCRSDAKSLKNARNLGNIKDILEKLRNPRTNTKS